MQNQNQHVLLEECLIAFVLVILDSGIQWSEIKDYFLRDILHCYNC